VIYGADWFCLSLGGKLNESETCGLRLELGLATFELRLDDCRIRTRFRGVGLEDEDLNLYVDLPLRNLTTSLLAGFLTYRTTN